MQQSAYRTRQPSIGTYPDCPHLFHYVPGEICVVTTTDPGAPDPYLAVRDFLNNEVTPRLPIPFGPNPAPGSPTPFQQDFGPTAIWGDFRIAPAGAAPDDGLFRPLTRAAISPSFGFPFNKPRIWFHFYRLALAPEATIATLQNLATMTRQTINIIWDLVDKGVAQAKLTALTGATMQSAGPNWFTVKAGSGANSPGTPAAGPGGLALFPPVAATRFKFSDPNANPPLGNPALHALVNHQRTAASTATPQSGVTVAVLDTCPDPGAVVRAQVAFGGNHLLQSLADRSNPVSIGAAPSLNANADFPHLIPFLPNILGLLAGWLFALNKYSNPQDPNLAVFREDNFGAPDHGLFVTGIIRDIAPGADLHLIRVLDNAGMGDALAIVAVLWELMQNPPSPLIINMSLTFDVPPRGPDALSDFLLQHWFKNTVKDPSLLSTKRAQIEKIFGFIRDCIDVMFEILEEQGVLVVASAGNDALWISPRPESCLPAGEPTVLSVTAMSRDTGPAQYSNLSSTTHGVATLGGDGLLAGNPASVAMDIDPGLPTQDAILGIASAPDIPPTKSANPVGGGTNRSGWIFWAGTSFSAPIITGIAATLLADDLANGRAPRPPAAIIKTIQAFADPNLTSHYGGVLQCPILYATQF